MKKTMKYCGVALAAAALSHAPANAQEIKRQSDFAPAIEELREMRKAEPDKSVRVNLPLFESVLSFDLFAPFEPAFAAETPEQILMEYAAQGDNVEDWSRLITVLGFKGLGTSAPVTTEKLLKDLTSNTGKCLDGFSGEILEQGQLTNGATYALTFLSCASVSPESYPGASADNGEQYVSYFFRDDKNLYSLQYALRDRSGGPLALNADTAKAIVKKFGDISLCSKTDNPEACKASRAAETQRKDSEN